MTNVKKMAKNLIVFIVQAVVGIVGCAALVVAFGALLSFGWNLVSSE